VRIPSGKGQCISSRRDFLKGSASIAAALALPTIVPASLFGANAPSNKILVGFIGVGRMGFDDMTTMLGFEEVRVVAVCDVDSKRAENARKRVDAHYAEQGGGQRSGGCAAYGDYRELIAREDVDAVLVCTPDHWHTLPAVAAARAGKDVFVQKPLSLTIAEGRALSDAVKRHGRVFLVGSQQRSDSRFRFACELVRNGRIGRLHTITVAFGLDPGGKREPDMPIPPNLNYDMWLGQAPWASYTENRVHPQNDYGRPGWLRISDYGAGMITGWGTHHMDIAHWGMGAEFSGPLEIEGWAEYPRDGLWDVHTRFYLEYLYPNDVRLTCTGSEVNKEGVVFQGTEGWVHVTRGFLDAHPKSLLTSIIGPDEIHLYESRDHFGNFVECLRTRAETIAPAEVAHRSCSACLLGDIAMRLGRKVRWDAAQERFLNDDEANRMLSRPMRAPWHL